MTDGIIVDPQTQEQEQELELTPQKKVENEPEIPEKYRGKSLLEVIEMHRNAESELGRRANEIGHYRSLIDELITVKRQRDLAENQDEPEKELEISGDELLTDPAGTLTKVVERVLERRLKPVEQRITQREELTELEKFERDFPNAEAIAQDPQFHQWIMRKPSRIADAKLAAQKDLNAARRLLENYLDFQEAAGQTAAEPEKEPENTRTAPTGVEGARKVATERGGDGSPKPKKIFYQNEVVELMIRNPEKYRSEQYQKELTQAIKEGRLRK